MPQYKRGMADAVGWRQGGGRNARLVVTEQCPLLKIIHLVSDIDVLGVVSQW